MATRDYVPNANGEGNIGTSALKWAGVNAKTVNSESATVDTLNVKNLNAEKMGGASKTIIEAVTAGGLNNNGKYRGKNWGTISSSNIATFLSEHKVAEGTFEDLFLGDYFTIQDGKYNKTWEIVGFDCYYNKGDTAFTKHHLVLMPRENLTTSYMNATNDTTGGYNSSYMHQTLIPEINTALTTALGSRLLTRRALLSTSMSATIASGAGAGWMGASNNWAWQDVKACLASEVEIYGSRVFSSSFYDIGEACERLPIFQFKNHVTPNRTWFWLRAVASSGYFCRASAYGVADGYGASVSGGGVRPLICVG